jgi:hypothetical protein
MEHNLWTIKKVLQKHIKIIDWDSELSNTEKIDTLKYWCSIAIADIMRGEWNDDEKNWFVIK